MAAPGGDDLAQPSHHTQKPKPHEDILQQKKGLLLGVFLPAQFLKLSRKTVYKRVSHFRQQMLLDSKNSHSPAACFASACWSFWQQPVSVLTTLVQSSPGLLKTSEGVTVQWPQNYWLLKGKHRWTKLFPPRKRMTVQRHQCPHQHAYVAVLPNKRVKVSFSAPEEKWPRTACVLTDKTSASARRS